MSKNNGKLKAMDPMVERNYQRYLSEVMPLMDPKLSRLWQSVIKDIASKDKKVAIELIKRTKNIFSVIPLQQRGKLLLSLEKLNELDLQTSLSFFDNAPLAMAILDDSDFKIWEAITLDLTGENTEIAILFLKMTPKMLKNLEMVELLKWVKKGKKLLKSDPQIANAFLKGSFSGLENSFEKTNKYERSYLLDIGASLAIVNWKCVQSFFENAPEVLAELSAKDFAKWVVIGENIAEESTFYGSDYYSNSFVTLKNANLKYCGTILRNACLLLKKESLLAGIYFSEIPKILLNMHPREIGKWVDTGIRVFETNREIAISYFRNSRMLLEDLDVTELEEWAMNGLRVFEKDPSNARLYFSLRSRSSREFVEHLMSGVALKRVSKVLKYYAFGISGINFVIRSHNLLPKEHVMSAHPVVSGRVIYLEPTMKGYGDFEENFNIYKLSVMHEVGHAQFGTSKCTVGSLLSLLEKIGVDSDTTFLKDLAEKEKDVSKSENVGKQVEENEIMVNFSAAIGMFPNPFVTTDIMGIVEDARIEYKTVNLYKGLRREFKKVKEQMLLDRQNPEGRLEKFMEALLLVSIEHEPLFEIDDELKVPFEKTRNLLEKKILQSSSSTFDSLEVTFEIYSMLEENLGSLKSREYDFIRNLEYRGQGAGLFSMPKNEKEFAEQILERFIPQKLLDQDEDTMIQDELQSGPRCATSMNWDVLGNYIYDEWDARIKDYKSEWCKVYEVLPIGESNDFYQNAIEQYNPEISLINRIFKMMKPESFTKLRRQTDGDEIDFDAITEAFTDRKCGINPTDRLYIRRDKRERDVATLFLVDISASTEKELDNGKSILDIEKEALVIMIEALESIGDKYAIYAFSGDTRADVEYYNIKDFDEKFSEDVECKIGALEPAYNTRLGTAIRHSITKLKQVDAKIKLLVLLSDGEPYDLSFGEGKYAGKIAIEDTRMAIQEGNTLGMHFFCITVDTEASDYMDSIFSDVGYTIIDNAASLPERLPILYNRITT
ncbi:nitric oxide reductase activation protein NorD [Methanococcoides sp. AM1]|uniref:nitric oxide reductase activation protein NorD n=1 Tax=Methanococcoides sp. AM1 TaxID=1201011 RepID=UPI0010824C31|nr:VWA domain-containing protein [Methanococcoides sp. AM1]